MRLNITMMTARTSVPTFLLGALLSMPAMADMPLYQVLDLGTLGGLHTFAADLNDAGQVAGTSFAAFAGDEIEHAFLYEDGEMRDLGTLGGIRSQGAAINNLGQVTGEAETATGFTHAFVYADGVMRDLGTLGGTFSSGRDINNAGQVTGVSAPGNTDSHAVLFSRGSIKNLDTLGGRFSTGEAINAFGEVAGTYNVDFESHAFLYARDRTTRDLVPGRPSYLNGTHVINNAGQVTGVYFRSDGSSRGFVYYRGHLTDVPTLGGNHSDGMAINSFGHVTGSSVTASGEDHAFIYALGRTIDLGTLGGDFSLGYAINDFDQVVGQSVPGPQSPSHAFVYAHGRMIDLHALLGGLAAGLGTGELIESVATDINRAGQVIGTFHVANADPVETVIGRAFIATPVSLLFDRLLNEMTRVGPGRSLAMKVRLAWRSYAAQDKAATCSLLGAFTQEATAQAGRKIPRDLAEKAIDEAHQISTTVGCS